MSYKKRKYFVALIPALLQYLSISYKYKTCVGSGPCPKLLRRYGILAISLQDRGNLAGQAHINFLEINNFKPLQSLFTAKYEL